MPSPHRRSWLDSWLVPAILAVAGGLVLAFLHVPAEEQPVNDNHAAADAQAEPGRTLTTSDGVVLAATYAAPEQGQMLPAVILVHGFTFDRHQWDAYVDDFVEHGFAVLAYDSRGAGESAVPSQPDTAEHFAAMTQDVAAAIDYLRHQPDTDPNRVSIIGAGLGGNLAYVASGAGFPLHRAVALSPSFASGFLTGDDIENFSPAGIMAVAHERHRNDVETIMRTSAEPKKEMIVTAEEVHGVDLLYDAERFDEVIAWIE